MAMKITGADASEPSPALAVQYRSVADLQEYDNNPRRNDTEIPKMVELIKKFGFKVPILIRGDRIVDGHLRIKAAKALQMKSVPTIDVGDMGEPEERALRIALNKSVEWAKWDTNALAVEMKAISDAGLDLTLTGFGTKDAEDMISKIAAGAISEPPMKDPAGPLVPKTKDADAGTPADPNYVSVTFHMSAENRAKIMGRLTKVQSDNKLPNISAALLHALSDE